MNQPLDIRPDHLWQVKSVLREHLPPGVKVFAFGSRAKWTTRNSSDLDICLKGENALPDKALSRIDIDLEESVIPYKVDVIDWNRITPEFQANIKDDLAEINIMEWDTVPLSLVCENMDGLRTPITKADRKSGQYPYYGATGIIDHVDNYIYEGTYLLVAEDGENLRSRKLPIAFLAKGKFWVNNHAHVLRSNKYSNIEFLLYAVSQADIEIYLTGTTMPKLTQANLNSIPILMPPPDEQMLISRILQSLDEKIELNRQMNEALETMVRAIFKDWFIDFGPARAKAAGREPYLPPELWALFPDALDDEDLPANWRQGQVSDFARLKGGQQLTKDKFVDDGPVPVFGGAGIMGRTDRHNADGFVITVGRVGAYCGQFFSHRGKAWVNNNASLITPNLEVSGEWLFLALRALDINLIKKGAAQPFVSNSDILAMNIVDPGNAVLSAFHTFIKPAIFRREVNDIESVTLSKVRDALLPKLMSCEISFADEAHF